MRTVGNMFYKVVKGIQFVIYRLVSLIYSFLRFGAIVGLIFVIKDVIEMRGGVPFGQTKYFTYLFSLYGSYLIFSASALLFDPNAKETNLLAILKHIFLIIF